MKKIYSFLESANDLLNPDLQLQSVWKIVALKFLNPMNITHPASTQLLQTRGREKNNLY